MFNYRMQDSESLDWVDVAEIGELDSGRPLRMDIGGQAVAVFQIAGELFAIADVCSHDDGPLAEGTLDGVAIECPRHGAHFDIATGKALSLPAVVDIPAYPVRVLGSAVQVGLPAK
jgi:3-phenylpropionate/trans-cinnamate dioxygenase ferredoxin subunit